MDWQKQMNQAMAYIEGHLGDHIDYTSVAKIVGCSEWEFRRMFSFLAQMPLSEYIRRRRLGASLDGLKSGEKIIEIAQRFGYESHAAYSRAFKQLYGVTPSFVRQEQLELKPFKPLTFKLVLKEESMFQKGDNSRVHYLGARESGYAIAIDMEPEAIHKTNEYFWDSVGTELVGGTALPKYGAYVTEESCGFFKEVSGKKVLEIGCGTGHSLQYLGARGADELWGLDISRDQIERSRQYLRENHLEGTLICSPMEVECGIPEDYFDYVFSVYGIGWTTDLEATFQRVASYLKKGGTFIFSWSHPIHKCVAPEGDELIFKKNYYDESWYRVNVDGNTFSLADRKLSTYINGLARAGMYLEELVEETEEALLKKSASKLGVKAKMLPVTFVIKARKH